MLFTYSDNIYLVPMYEVLNHVLYGECVHVCVGVGWGGRQTDGGHYIGNKGICVWNLKIP